MSKRRNAQLRRLGAPPKRKPIELPGKDQPLPQGIAKTPFIPRVGGALPTRRDFERAGINIVCATPNERQLPTDAFPFFWGIASHGYPILPTPYGRVDIQRNALAIAMLLRPEEFTHIVMMDIDHMHPVDTVERLGRWILEDQDKLVIGSLNFRRGEPFDPMIYLEAPDGQLRPPLEWEQGLGEVAAIGHGSIMISRKVFEKARGPWWAYTYHYFGDQGPDKPLAERFNNPTYPSEDIYFCQVCRENQIKMYCDTTLTAPHLITATVDESTFRGWLSAHPDQTVVMTDPTDGIQGDTVPEMMPAPDFQWMDEAKNMLADPEIDGAMRRLAEQ